MGRKALLAVVCWLTLSEALGEAEKTVNSSIADNESAESAPRLYNNIPVGVYASAAPYASYSFHAPAIVSAPSQHAPVRQVVIQNSNRFLKNLKDSYGQYVQAPQTAAYKNTFPQQFVQLQELPAHLSQPLVASAAPSFQYKQSVPHFFFGSQPYRVPSLHQAATPTPITRFGSISQPLAYAQNIRSFAPSSGLYTNVQRVPISQQQSDKGQAFQGYGATFHRLQDKPQTHVASSDNNNDAKQQASHNQNGQIQAAPAQTSVTAIVNGKKTVITLETKPPLPLLDLNLLEPLTFDNPLVPQVQHFLPRINAATYHTLPQFNEAKNHQKEIVVQKTKSYDNEVIVGKPKKQPPKKKQNKPRPKNIPLKPTVIVTGDVNGSPEITYEINEPGYKETYKEQVVKYNKETNSKPVTYTYNEKTHKEPVTYSFTRTSKEPVQIKHVEYESDPQNPKELIYKFKPEQQEEEQKEEGGDPPSQDSEDSGESSAESEEEDPPSHPHSTHHSSPQNHGHHEEGPRHSSHHQSHYQEKPSSHSHHHGDYHGPPPNQGHHKEHHHVYHQESPRHSSAHGQRQHHETPPTHSHHGNYHGESPNHGQHRGHYAGPTTHGQHHSHHEGPSTHGHHHNHHEGPSTHGHHQSHHEGPSTHGHHHGDHRGHHESPRQSHHLQPEHREEQYHHQPHHNAHHEVHHSPPQFSQPLVVTVQNEFQPITPEYEEDIRLLPPHQPNAQIKVDPNQHVQLGPSTPHQNAHPSPAPQGQAPDHYEQEEDHHPRPHSSPAPAPHILEKSKRIIIKENEETPDEMHSHAEQLMAQMLEQEENNEEDFEKAYKESAFGFPAYEETADVEKDIFNPETYGVPRDHDEYDVEHVPFQQYTREGDEFPKSVRAEYKDARDKTKEEYFLDYAVNKPVSLRDRYRHKEDYYKTYMKHRPEKIFVHDQDEKKKQKQKEKYIAAPSFSFHASTTRPKQKHKQYFAQYKAAPKFEYNYEKESPRDNSAHATGAFRRFKTHFVEPQFQYGFEPIAAPLTLDSELAAMASNDSPETEKPGIRKKIYKENWYIKKTSTTAGKPS